MKHSNRNEFSWFYKYSGLQYDMEVRQAPRLLIKPGTVYPTSSLIVKTSSLAVLWV